MKCFRLFKYLYFQVYIFLLNCQSKFFLKRNISRSVFKIQDTLKVNETIFYPNNIFIDENLNSKFHKIQLMCSMTSTHYCFIIDAIILAYKRRVNNISVEISVLSMTEKIPIVLCMSLSQLN